MKFSTVLLGSLAFAAPASAQYFSEGWSPGQKSGTPATPVPTYAPQEEVKSAEAPVTAASGGGIFDISTYLKSGPVVSLLAQFGFNITEKLDDALARNKIWDDRIPLITDENYNDIIVNENLTEEEEKERVWFLVITVTASKQDGVSRIIDDTFDAAYNTSQLTGDLPHVRWGRIDYISVTTITTKWAVWQAPYLVVLTDRGQTLRFYKASQIRINEEAMLNFLKVEGWKNTQPWSTAYSPGGSREYIMDYMAQIMTKVYNVTVMVPKWILFLISGGVASVAINLLHGNSAPAVSAKHSKPAIVSSSVTQDVPSPGSPSANKRASAKQRKSGKK